MLGKPILTRPKRDYSHEYAHLTARLIAVGKLLPDGLTNKEIADSLGTTEGTVKQYVSEILKLLHMKNRAQVAVWFSRALTLTLATFALMAQSFTVSGPQSPVPSGPMTLSVGYAPSTSNPDMGIRDIQFTASSVPASATITAGPSVTTASKTIQCNMTAVPVKCLIASTTSTQANILPGILATISYTPTASGMVTVGDGLGALPQSTAVAFGSASFAFTLGAPPPPPLNPCDLNGDGVVNQADVLVMQSRVLAAAGTTAPTVSEFQKMVIAALTVGGTCTIQP